MSLNCSRIDNARRYCNQGLNVSLRRARSEPDRAANLKVDAEHQPGLVTFEIDEIKARI